MRTSWALLGAALLLLLAYEPVLSAPGSAGRDVLDTSNAFSFLENFGMAAEAANDDENESPHDHNSEVNRLNHYFLDEIEEAEESAEESSEEGDDEKEQAESAEESSESHEAPQKETAEAAKSVSQSAESPSAAPTSSAQVESSQAQAQSSESPISSFSMPAHTSPYDDLVAIFSALGDKDAASNSRKIMQSIPFNQKPSEAASPAASSASILRVRVKARDKSATPSASSAPAALQPSAPANKIADSPSFKTKVLQDGPITLPPADGTTNLPPSTSLPDNSTGAGAGATTTVSPAPVVNSTDASNTTNSTSAPIVLRHKDAVFIKSTRIIPIYDDAPNPTDGQVKAVQGSGGWRAAKMVPKETLSACNKGDPCPPPTVPGQDPPPLTPLQQNKINADAAIQKKFDKPVVTPKGWVKPIHHDCGDNCAVVSTPDPTPPPDYDPKCPSGQCK